MTSVDEIFTSSLPRKRHCPLCDKPRAFQVQVQIRELDERGMTGAEGSRSKAKSVGFCAEHAAQFFTSLADELVKATS